MQLQNDNDFTTIVKKSCDHMLLLVAMEINLDLSITTFRWNLPARAFIRLTFDCNVMEPILLEYGCQSFFRDAEINEPFFSDHIKESFSRSVRPWLLSPAFPQVLSIPPIWTLLPKIILEICMHFLGNN